MNPDGSNVFQLTPDRISIYYQWSPDGNYIVYSYLSGNDEWTLYVINSDGSGRKQLTVSNEYQARWSWSPDSSYIVVVSDHVKDGKKDIYAINVETLEAVRLTNNSTVESSPIWTSDGKKILYRAERDGQTRIYALNIDGTGEEIIDSEVIPLFGLSDSNWSRDGSQIAYTSYLGLTVVNANDWTLEHISTDAEDYCCVSWEP